MIPHFSRNAAVTSYKLRVASYELKQETTPIKTHNTQLGTRNTIKYDRLMLHQTISGFKALD